MPRIRSSSLETATARLRFTPSWVPYPGPTLARGIKLLYRRNKTGAGTWVVRVANSLMPATAGAKAPYWTKAIGLADDHDPADGVGVLNYGQAQDRAKELVRGGGEADTGKPATVAQALDAYERDLISRSASAANAQRVRYHMTPVLAARPVALLTVQDLRGWRDGLTAKGLSPAGVNRTCVGLRAALEFAHASDQRIKNRDAFRLGLKALPHANRARRMVLPDADVWRIVDEAYGINRPFGLLVEVLAQTGARMSQAVRITCGDLIRPGDRLMIPMSRKGGGQKKREGVSVPISAALAAALQASRGDRADDEPLLINAKATRWHATDKTEQRAPFRLAVERAGLDPDEITPYALRHSSICRSLLAGVPETIVAKLHDTSSGKIASNYGKFIDSLADDVARRGLLRRTGDNVVPLRREA